MGKTTTFIDKLDRIREDAKSITRSADYEQNVNNMTITSALLRITNALEVLNKKIEDGRNNP